METNNIFLICNFSAVVGPTIDTTTGLQIQPATAYATLPAQYPIYAPTAIYSHLPATTLIQGALPSPNKEGLLNTRAVFHFFRFALPSRNNLLVKKTPYNTANFDRFRFY